MTRNQFRILLFQKQQSSSSSSNIVKRSLYVSSSLLQQHKKSTGTTRVVRFGFNNNNNNRSLFVSSLHIQHKQQQQQHHEQHRYNNNNNKSLLRITNRFGTTNNTTFSTLTDTKYSNTKMNIHNNNNNNNVILNSYDTTTTASTTMPTPNDVSVTLTSDTNTSSSSSSSSLTTTSQTTETTTTQEMNLFTSINHALHIAMSSNDTTIIFGQDVAFGGVFRCTQQLQSIYGTNRVFNTPLSEVGIIGFAVGYTSTIHNSIAIAEIQFADYIFPALDQICNEVAKFRYRSGNQWDCGGITIRTPYGCVGHGGHYHSQSPESYLCHTAGLTVVVPRSPKTAKGLLLSSIRSSDPVIFLEPKALYRTYVEHVPIHDYEIPLSQAEIIRSGHDITLIGWGQQLRIIEEACLLVESNHNISCEIIDLQTLVPCDYETIIQSVQKTGKCIIVHEAPITLGLGAEICSIIQQECFYHLLTPIQRICGYDIPFPLIHEKYYIPDTYKIYEAILQCMEDAK